MNNTNSFEVILTTKSKAKNNIGNVLIETSVKGLIYRSEVYMNDHLIDAIEVNCSDISTIDKYEEIFQARYSAHHSKMEDKYTQERVFTRVTSTEGDYADGEGLISVVTSISDKHYKLEVFLDSQSLEVQQEELENADEKVFTAKYTQAHKNLVAKYILIPKFPANTFINPVIKKFPMYKKSPMTAFVFFLATIAIVIWILSIIVCGKALKKIVTAVAGKQAGLVVKDLQKTLCKRSAAEAAAEDNVVLLDANGNLIKDGLVPNYVVLPKDIKFKTDDRIYTVYIKNNMFEDTLIVLRDRIIFNFENALVDPNMVINVLNKEAVHIKSGKVGQFEFKLESSFLQTDSVEEIGYNGSIVLDATNLKTRKVSPLIIKFEFSVNKNQVDNAAVSQVSSGAGAQVVDLQETVK